MKPNLFSFAYGSFFLFFTMCATGLSAQIPTADAGQDIEFCEGQSGQLSGDAWGGTQPYYYTWWCDTTNTPCAIDSVFDDDPMVSPLATTTYYLQVTDAMGMLSPIDSVSVFVLPTPVVDAGPDVFLCPDPAPCQNLQASISNAPGPYTYRWTPGSGINDSTILNPCARPAATTTYTLQAFSGMCSSDPADTNAQVTVVVHPMPIADAGANTELCEGDTVQLQGIAYGAGPNYFYEWSPLTGLSSTSVPNPLAYPTQTTNYVLTPWSNGCPGFGDTVLVIVHPQPAAPTVTQSFDTLFASAAPQSYTYRWCLNGQVISGANDQFLVVTGSGNYEAKIVSNFGCVSQSSGAITGREEGAILNGMHVYPNPVVDRVSLRFETAGNYKVALVDLQGKVLQELSGKVGRGGELEMGLPEALPEGMYLLRVESDAGASMSQVLRKF